MAKGMTMTDVNVVNCLLCLKSLQTHKPLKWQDDESVEGIDNESCAKVNDQLSVIFLLRKLLDVPIDICAELLQSFGDPYYWITCCSSCSVIVDKGRQIFNQIVLLQKQLEKVQNNLKSSIYNSGQLFLNCENSSTGATEILRSYVTNELKRTSAPVENNGSIMEVDHFQLQYSRNPLNSCSSQRGKNSDCTWDDDLNIKSEPEILLKIKNDMENIDSNSNSEKFEAHAEFITGDLDLPSGTNCGTNSSTTVNSISNDELSKWKGVTRKHHTGEMPFTCSICGKGFSRAGVLKRHILTHTGERPFKCDICGIRFSRSDNLKAHVIAHSEETPFKCDICGEGFSYSINLRRHKKKHIAVQCASQCTGAKPFKCKICVKRFIQPHHLKAHILTHTGERPFKCDICGNGFSQSSHLKEHIRTHTKEKPFKCDICEKCFSKSCTLKGHLRNHTGERPYTCDTCGKGFSHSQQLRRHLYVHNGEKLFKCDTCGKYYQTSSNLRKHKVTHAKNKRNTVPKILTPAGETPKDEYILP